jgi:hypothetical protein
VCGATLELEGHELQKTDLFTELELWRTQHTCLILPEESDDRPVGGTAQVEQAPDYQIPEMHIGFRG